MSSMRITDGKGVQFTFENGITISIQIGQGNYSDNYGWKGDYKPPTRENPLPASSKAEIAVWDEEGNWFDLNGDQVAGYVPVEKVLAFVEYLRALPKGTISTHPLDLSSYEDSSYRD